MRILGWILGGVAIASFENKMIKCITLKILLAKLKDQAKSDIGGNKQTAVDAHKRRKRL